MARDEDPTPSEWLVLLRTNDAEERVPAAVGGVDVGVMSAGDLHFVVISDASHRAVWLRPASMVLKVSRCAP